MGIKKSTTILLSREVIVGLVALILLAGVLGYSAGEYIGYEKGFIKGYPAGCKYALDNVGWYLDNYDPRPIVQCITPPPPYR